MKKITLFLFSIFSLVVFSQTTVETFDNSTATGSYNDGSFVGVDNVNWNYVHVRNEGDFEIDGAGIMLRRANEPSSLSATLPNGLGNLSVDGRKAFTGNATRRLEVVVNDIVVQQFEQDFPDGGSDLVVTFDVNNINEPGPVDLELRLFGTNGNQQLVLDNLTWTDFDGEPQPFLSINSPSNNQVLTPFTTEVQVEFTVNNFDVSAEGSMDGEGYIVYSINEGDFMNLFAGDDLFVDTSASGEYDVFMKLVDVNGNDLDPSVEASVSFISPEVLEVNNITELRADYQENGAGRFYEITGASTMSHSDDFNNRKWFQDENFSGIMIFDNSSVIAEDAYEVGDQVTNLVGETVVFNGVLQFAPLVDNGVVVGNQMPETQIITISQYLADFQAYESTLIGFQNVSFVDADGSAEFANNQNYDFTDGQETTEMRTTFFDVDYIGTVIPSGALDGLRGVASQFNGTAQIFPRDLNDIDVVLSINGFEKTQFSLYPNPAKNFVNLEVPAGESFEVNIYNVTGKKVYSTKINGSTRLDVNSLQSGMYMINFKQGNQNTTRKLIIN